MRQFERPWGRFLVLWADLLKSFYVTFAQRNEEDKSISIPQIAYWQIYLNL